jgi:hypothetical protein
MSISSRCRELANKLQRDNNNLDRSTAWMLACKEIKEQEKQRQRNIESDNFDMLNCVL